MGKDKQTLPRLKPSKPPVSDRDKSSYTIICLPGHEEQAQLETEAGPEPRHYSRECRHHRQPHDPLCYKVPKFNDDHIVPNPKILTGLLQQKFANSYHKPNNRKVYVKSTSKLTENGI